jgi:hypothetical protein
MNLDDLKSKLKADDDATIEVKKAMWNPYNELEQLRKVAIAAARSVSNPAWAGVCDEDMELELALREAGFLPWKKSP